MRLTIENLVKEAQIFCNEQSQLNHRELFGVTDGKAVGTYVEHKFKEHLLNKYEVDTGNSAKGIDLPSEDINTDIKVTYIKQPQSSCPFKDAKQKVFGLEYNLLVFVYNKTDDKVNGVCRLDFINCTFVDKLRTADFTTTSMLSQILNSGFNRDIIKEDIIAHFCNINLPGDEITYNIIAEEVIKNPPYIGYLTISNALQWRLQYKRVISLNNTVKGVLNII
ncbi:restriction endonuclease [Clostridium sp.]|uniref:restriction endonuclease n=1 Tax=Clostridium sp. TaxID=1506 RepID=UPI002FDCBB55